MYSSNPFNHEEDCALPLTLAALACTTTGVVASWVAWGPRRRVGQLEPGVRGENENRPHRRGRV